MCLPLWWPPGTVRAVFLSSHSLRSRPPPSSLGGQPPVKIQRSHSLLCEETPRVSMEAPVPQIVLPDPFPPSGILLQPSEAAAPICLTGDRVWGQHLAMFNLQGQDFCRV